jgi:2-keto-4-pentenoate hydratase/2-oxohepta-3-ene-1,7-dioic acid hydratase in catechol pathway
MRIVIFGESRRVGALVNDRVIDLQRAAEGVFRERGDRDPAQVAQSRVPATLEAFIAAGPEALDAARRAIEYATQNDPADVVYAAAAVRLHAPWPGRRIACVGGNYADHLLGMLGGTGHTLESVTRSTRDAGQWGFWKVPSEVAGPGDMVPYPKRTEYFDYEGEAAIVVGKRGKDITAGRLDEFVWGVTLLNDWSIRDSFGRTPRPMSYNEAKNFDGSTSLGPSIVVGELDPCDVQVEVRVNNSPRQNFSTRDMIFSFGEALEYLSRDFTFVPGDIISGGTARGTAADQSPAEAGRGRPKDLFLKPGDTVTVSNPTIGTLHNQVVASAQYRPA